MVVHSIVWSGAVNLWASGTYICIKLPIKTLNVLWETQLFFLFLPFKCANRIFRLIVPSIPENNAEKLLKTIMCCDLNEDDKVLNAFHDIQTSSFVAINRMNVVSNERKRHEHMSNKAILDTCQESTFSEITNSSDEEQNHVESLELSTPEPRSIALADEKVHASETDKCAPLPNIPERITERCMQEHIIAMSIHKFFQSYFDGLRKQAEEIREMKNKCPDVVNHSNAEQSIFEIFNDSFFKFPVSDISNFKISGGVDKLQTLTRLLDVENSQLKEHLKVTNEQLNDIRTATLCLSQRVLSLELQLNQVKDILHNVAADRNTMQKKLLILQQMIEEEEIYLNDDSSRDDSYNDLYVTASNHNFPHDLETSSPLENQSVAFTKFETNI